MSNSISDNLIQALSDNDKRLSRTVASGVSDTSVSAHKEALLLKEAALANAITLNRLAVVSFIRGVPKGLMRSAPDLNAAMITLASLTLSGMLPTSLYRQWNLGDRKFGPPEDSKVIGIEDIPERLRALAVETVNRFQNDPVKAAALLEWEIGVGPLHPFYDACGRISRSCSALVLLCAGIDVPIYPQREEYFEIALLGKCNFASAYQAWIDEI